MTGLIYKDFLALKGHLTTYLVFFLVYGGLCLSGVFTASVLCGMVVLMSLITPMTTVTSDDVSRWNRFAIATPACRRGVVTGKYLFTLLVTLASTVFVSLLLVVLAVAVGALLWLEPYIDYSANGIKINLPFFQQKEPAPATGAPVVVTTPEPTPTPEPEEDLSLIHI